MESLLLHLKFKRLLKISCWDCHKVIDILERVSHSISYIMVEKKDTEISFRKGNRELITSKGIHLTARFVLEISRERHPSQHGWNIINKINREL